MKDFNIAKYLKENHLGSHAILGAYVDLHALKEEEVGNNKPVSKVPYTGADKKLDGFGDEFDQVDPVEEMDNSMTGDKGWQYDDEDEFVTVVGEVDSALGVKVGDVIRNPNRSETLTVKRIVKKVNRGDDPENPKYPIYTAYLDSSIKAGRDEYPFDLYTLSKAIERGGYELNPMNEAGFEYDDKDDVDPLPSLSPKYKGDYSNEQDKFDRMMGLAHEYFEKVSPVVRKTIDALRADGFDDQDIMDFLATDFTLEEEVTVSSSGVEMEEVAKDEFSNIINTLNGIAKKVKPTGAKLSFDDDSSSDAILVQVVTKDGDFKLQKAVHAEVKKLIQKANSGFKVSRIEQDSPGRISFSIDKVNLESIEEAADFTKFVKVGNVYDNYHDATGGFRMKLKVVAVDPVNQTITAVDENGRERRYSAYQFTNDFRAEDPNPIDSKWTDPGYKNRD